MKRYQNYLLLVYFCFIMAIDCTAQFGRSTYKIRLDQPRQTILGLGVEIQSDAIGSGNIGLPDEVIAVPNNLVPSERERLYKDMLKGFRYCRLAMGLYFRGLDSAQKHIVERYPNQINDLKEMMHKSGMEGLSVEYWSPAPYWKSTDSYLGGTLKSFDEDFLHRFGDALVADAKYLTSNGFKISFWGLQNEALLYKLRNTSYSHCGYLPEDYYKAFKVVAPKIRKALPATSIIVDSWHGHLGQAAQLIRLDQKALALVDAWVLHKIGANSNIVIDWDTLMQPQYTMNKPVFTNEFEYGIGQIEKLSGENGALINTAQTIMNWMTFADSPTWFWLHALKPTYNEESVGYSLGIWRPEDDIDTTKFGQIKKGHWDYTNMNFNAIAGFLKYMPWDSQRYHVEEDEIRKDNRIMAFKTPNGKLVVVLTNRSGQPFQFDIDTGSKAKFAGYRYTLQGRDIKIGQAKGTFIKPVVPNWAVEFWVEQ